jgi:hypothetical protein
MTKRLQLVLKDTEYREIQRAARSRNISVADWVRQALGIVRPRGPSAGLAKKLKAIRVAARHEYPTAGVDSMFSEIESGYRRDSNP